MLRPALYLADHTRVRYATGALAYFAQGIPMGLLHVALPAWLASQGVSAGGVAAFLSIITLPWAFKLIAGPLMDHWEYLPMGKHRPWVLAAQLGMVVSLLALVTLDDPLGQLTQLTAICFLINAFTATQDVAVDGMEIDFVPLHEEGHLNAFMSFGKAIGGAISAAVTGTLLVVYGIGVVGLVCAAGAAIILVVLVLIREREDEKFLPWTKGEASPLDEPPLSWRKVFSELNHVLWLKPSLIIMGIMFFDGLTGGYGRVLMSIAAINLFGYTTPQWSDINALMSLVGAVLALGLGPLIDRHGAKRMLFLSTALLAVHAFLLAFTQQMWTTDWYVMAMISAWVILQPVGMVCALAIAMSIVNHSLSATQFAIYMSVSNLGAAIGSAAYGYTAGVTGWSQNYTLMGALIVVMMFAILMFRTHDHPEVLLEKR
jgi:PAT family beta-lactamase induction signal transducer AmpG